MFNEARCWLVLGPVAVFLFFLFFEQLYRQTAHLLVHSVKGWIFSVAIIHHTSYFNYMEHLRGDPGICFHVAVNHMHLLRSGFVQLYFFFFLSLSALDVLKVDLDGSKFGALSCQRTLKWQKSFFQPLFLLLNFITSYQGSLQAD